ncbi:hypothetical protein FRUB_04467 [Fimbriiglobus ruber]|uniref:RNA polymerase sigma factor 70 region 4 type 2 domain-containing protein n=2 Tax=Fimbriiglobus ruber TaxID=1908690 RepID=A0A225DYR4_9BACT|nr:hypothetical protein FRUB_04467 [Fimbriiglobus ruber]
MILDSTAARDDLLTRLESEFDREMFDMAVANIRLRVDPETWEAFRLTAIDGLSGAEAAVRIGMKVSAVYVNRGRVQKMLQDEVQRMDGPPDAGDES